MLWDTSYFTDEGVLIASGGIVDDPLLVAGWRTDDCWFPLFDLPIPFRSLSAHSCLVKVLYSKGIGIVIYHSWVTIRFYYPW